LVGVLVPGLDGAWSLQSVLELALLFAQVAVPSAPMRAALRWIMSAVGPGVVEAATVGTSKRPVIGCSVEPAVGFRDCSQFVGLENAGLEFDGLEIKIC
jgi:hypothetical protein